MFFEKDERETFSVKHFCIHTEDEDRFESRLNSFKNALSVPSDLNYL